MSWGNADIDGQKGRGIWKTLTFNDKGAGGSRPTLFLANIICKHPFNQHDCGTWVRDVQLEILVQLFLAFWNSFKGELWAAVIQD